ncbi:MAG: Glu/Leu/Phe/Val dehydrogenase dimerization domain-containing protein [Myxococcota bacterium]
MTSLLAREPQHLIDRLRELGGRGYVVRRPGGTLEASHAALDELRQFCLDDNRDFLDHEGLFFAVGPKSGALLAAFVHNTTRGQAAGGLRHWPYPTLEAFVRDGLRLAVGMTRKNATAGLWWGGGKGIIALREDAAWRERAYRDVVYAEYGRFVSSLQGCYVTAEDAGTTPPDMRAVFSQTRHTTCIPADQGGSGNPSGPTALGVVCAMEAALDVLGKGSLEGKRICMQGAGNVATFMMEALLARGVASIVASDINAARLDAVRTRLADNRVELRHCAPEDTSIFETPCDVFAPNALGGVLNPDTIGLLRTEVVCGAANNQLLDDDRDMNALVERGITYVPDFVANRMGIVNCANEGYGHVPNDPAIARHLGRAWEHSVFHATARVLQAAKTTGQTTAEAANALADDLATQPHPVWPGRSRQIIEGLVTSGWAT